VHLSTGINILDPIKYLGSYKISWILKILRIQE